MMNYIYEHFPSNLLDENMRASRLNFAGFFCSAFLSRGSGSRIIYNSGSRSGEYQYLNADPEVGPSQTLFKIILFYQMDPFSDINMLL
jgi:hypothetical protein